MNTISALMNVPEYEAQLLLSLAQRGPVHEQNVSEKVSALDFGFSYENVEDLFEEIWFELEVLDQRWFDDHGSLRFVEI